MRPSQSKTAMVAALLLASFAASSSAQAQPVADFYRGKTVNMLVGVGAGGEYDLLARLVAKYFGRHLPGNPNVVTQNMVGASGLKMANYMYALAPQDGTYVRHRPERADRRAGRRAAGHAVRRREIPLARLDRARGRDHGGVAHDRRQDHRGRPQARDRSPASTARGAITYGFPALMNEFLGTRFKIVSGYNGGNEINLAMERGEVEARNNSWSSWKTTKPAWLKDEQDRRHRAGRPAAPDLDAPSLEELAPHAGRAPHHRGRRLRHPVRAPLHHHAGHAGGAGQGAAGGLRGGR